MRPFTQICMHVDIEIRAHVEVLLIQSQSSAISTICTQQLITKDMFAYECIMQTCFIS